MQGGGEEAINDRRSLMFKNGSRRGGQCTSSCNKFIPLETLLYNTYILQLYGNDAIVLVLVTFYS